VYDFIDLKLVRFMAEEPSLSAVAARAKMSLPAVSQRLAKLEATLKTKLVFRSGRFGLTPEGQIFLESADAILGEVARLEGRLKGFHESHDELLRIVCTDAVLLAHLPAALKTITQERPTLRLQIVDADRDTAYHRLTADEADVALVPEGAARDHVQTLRYRSERVCLIAPLTHPVGQEVRPIPLAAVQRFDFVGLCDDAKYIERLCEENGIHLNHRVRVSSSEAQCLLVGQTLNGLALTYESTARRHARTQPINVIRLLDDWAVVHFVAALNAGVDPSPSCRRLLEKLAGE